MTTDDDLRRQTLSIVSAYQALISQKKFDEWIELWDEAGVCEFPYAPDGNVRRLEGRAAIYDYMTAYPGRFSIDSVERLRVHPMLDPQVAAVEVTIKGTAVETGRPYNQSYVMFVEVGGGKIVQYREYWNPLITMDALGGMDAWLKPSRLPAAEAASE